MGEPAGVPDVMAARSRGSRQHRRDRLSVVRDRMVTISLDYRLSTWNSSTPVIDVETADAMELRYDLFLGDVEFRIGQADFSARWGWVPVLDFAAGLWHVAQSLPETREEIFEFTESDASLRFVLEDDAVSVISNYAERIDARVSFREFRNAAESFLKRMVEELSNIYPGLSRNAEVQSMLGA
jgi:hypothetical protein